MTSRVLDVAAAVAALRQGQLIVFPTETLYGIGCDAMNPAAVERLCAVKQRPADKGIAVVIGDVEMLAQITERVGDAARCLMDAFWPGPLTLLFPARAGLPAPLVRDGLIGARLPGLELAFRLSSDLGRPIAAPSANPADRTPARDVAAARAYFGDAVSVYLDVGPIEGVASTVVDSGPPLRILRQGAVSAVAIEAALGGMRAQARAR